jgi:AAA+ ATPase superfamily predicted ATPase
MYFDTKPKSSLEDFFNYKTELECFVNLLGDSDVRMIVVKGLRRTGKTSLIEVGLNVHGKKHIFIDARSLEEATRAGFEQRLLKDIQSLDFPRKLLKRVRSVEFGLKVGVDFKKDVLDYLKGRRVILVVDEAHLLKGTRTEELLAYIYDHTDFKIVLSGSEVSLLESFVGIDDPKAALFARPFHEIVMKPLERDKSIEFLRKGLRQVRIRKSDEEIETAVNELDGIIGWLVMYGFYSGMEKYPLRKVVEYGKLLVRAEFENFLKNRMPAEKRYALIMEAVSKGYNSWKDIKMYAEVKSKRKISDRQFSSYLRSLQNFSFIQKSGNRYHVKDPLLRKNFGTD